MAYYVNKTDGTAILLLDGTKDTTSTSITLIGRLATNYGEVQNENFVRMLENFAYENPPSNPIRGQLWFDTVSSTVKVRLADTTWVEVGSNLQGNLNLTSNLSIGANTLQILSESGNVRVTNLANNKSLTFRTNVAGTITNALTINGNTGLVTVAGNPDTNLGIATKNYVDILETNISAIIAGINSNIANTNANVASVNSNLATTNSNLGSLSSNVSNGVGDINTNSLKIKGNTIITVSGAGNTVVNFQTPEGFTFLSSYGTTPTNNTTVYGQWTLAAGATLNSSYADLAEYYASDYEYEAGTVVVFGGEKEVTISTNANDTAVAGIVSTAPAYIMNTDLDTEKVCVALQGRVPCKVVGPIAKGDLVTTATLAGYAIKATEPKIGTIIGKSLENNTTQGPCIVQIAVGRC
jgi:hypothetical protein